MVNVVMCNLPPPQKKNIYIYTHKWWQARSEHKLVEHFQEEIHHYTWNVLKGSSNLT